MDPGIDQEIGIDGQDAVGFMFDAESGLSSQTRLPRGSVSK